MEKRHSAGLTRRQKTVLDAVIQFSKDWGYMPSVAELGRALGLAKSTVHFHIVSLVEKGYLAHDGSDHGLRIVQPNSQHSSSSPAQTELDPPDAISVPLVGTIAAGSPLDAFESDDMSVTVPTHIVRGRGPCFALRVKGTSMIEDGIFDGDIVIVRRQPTVDDGQIAVALLDDGSATLKRVYREARRIRLQPANAELDPIYVESIDIQGRVIGLIRLYAS